MRNAFPNAGEASLMIDSVRAAGSARLLQFGGKCLSLEERSPWFKDDPGTAYHLFPAHCSLSNTLTVSPGNVSYDRGLHGR